MRDALHDVTVTIVDRHDAHAVRPLDDLAGPATRQFFIIGFLGIAAQARTIVAANDDLVAEIENGAVVAGLIDPRAAAVTAR